MKLWKRGLRKDYASVKRWGQTHPEEIADICLHLFLQSDRFITDRSAMDFTIANYMVGSVKENSLNNDSVHSPHKVQFPFFPSVSCIKRNLIIEACNKSEACSRQG